MKNTISIESRINAIALPPTKDWLAVAKQYERELSWIDRSVRIAGIVLDRLDEIGMNQKTLAERMGVSPQYVSKIIKGRENLTLESIAKLEKALDMRLIQIAETVQISATINGISFVIGSMVDGETVVGITQTIQRQVIEVVGETNIYKIGA